MRSDSPRPRRARAPRRLPLLLPAVFLGWGLAAGCSATEASHGALAAAAQDAPPTDPDRAGDEDAAPFRPAPGSTRGDDWIRLVSGEWLRGELTGLDRDRIEFDSKKLDALELDWEDVAEVVTETSFTLLLTDRTSVVGVPEVRGDAVRLRTEAGVQDYSRAEVAAFVRGVPSERNYWSGKVKVGGTVRRGNTDQVDSTIGVAATRRTALSRLALSLDSVAGSVDGSERINNQTFRGSLDYYISPRVYARPFALELFKDRFQNIELRASPYAALGYVLLDRDGTEWDVTAGLGYRTTRYESVEEGEDDSDDLMTGVIGTAYASELTKNLDLTFAYSAQIGLEDSSDTNQDASLGLTFEFLWDLDFDFRVVWKRIGDPAADADGEVPDREDLRVDVGVSWGF